MNKVRDTVKAVREEVSRQESLGNDIPFPTGVTLFDEMLGGGLRSGYAVGDIIRITGPSKVGKTYWVMEAIAAAYHHFPKGKFKWIMDCPEGGFSFWNAPELWNLPVTRENIRTSATPQESLFAVDTFYNSLKDDEFGIYALDSLDGFLGEHQLKKFVAEKAVYDGETKKKAPGGIRAEVAAYMSEWYFPMLAKHLNSTSLTRKNGLFFFISQLRDNPAVPMAGKKPSGGNAAIFYADVRIDLWMAQRIMRKDTVFKEEKMVGSIVRAFCDKARNPRPERHLYYTFWTDGGIQEIETNIDFIYGLRQDSGQKGAANGWGACQGGEHMVKLKWEGKEITRKKLIKMAEEDREVEQQLQDKARSVWQKVEASVASPRRRKYE